MSTLASCRKKLCYTRLAKTDEIIKKSCMKHSKLSSLHQLNLNVLSRLLTTLQIQSEAATMITVLMRSCLSANIIRNKSMNAEYVRIFSNFSNPKNPMTRKQKSRRFLVWSRNSKAKPNNVDTGRGYLTCCNRLLYSTSCDKSLWTLFENLKM